MGKHKKKEQKDGSNKKRVQLLQDFENPDHLDSDEHKKKKITTKKQQP